MAGYYDYVLGIIPLALFGITGTLSFLGVGLTTAVPAGAIVAVGIMGHAMFVRGPVGSRVGDDVTASTDATTADPGFQSAD